MFYLLYLLHLLLLFLFLLLLLLLLIPFTPIESKTQSWICFAVYISICAYVYYFHISFQTTPNHLALVISEYPSYKFFSESGAMYPALLHALLFVAMLIFGTFNTVSSKLSFQTCAPGLSTCEPDPDSFCSFSFRSIIIILQIVSSNLQNLLTIYFQKFLPLFPTFLIPCSSRGFKQPACS